MSLVTRTILGYLCKDAHDTFLYCCSNCKMEFNHGCDLELHTIDHDIGWDGGFNESNSEMDSISGPVPFLEPNQDDGIPMLSADVATEGIIDELRPSDDKDEAFIEETSSNNILDQISEKTLDQALDQILDESLVEFLDQTSEIDLASFLNISLEVPTEKPVEGNEKSLFYGPMDEPMEETLEEPPVEPSVAPLHQSMDAKESEASAELPLDESTLDVPVKVKEFEPIEKESEPVTKDQLAFQSTRPTEERKTVSYKLLSQPNSMKMVEKSTKPRKCFISKRGQGFECMECSAKFLKKGNLMSHMAIHAKNREFYCCEICGKQVVDLNLHLKTHSSSKPYQCSECPASFRSSVSINDHIRKHRESPKKLTCSFCELVLFSNLELTRHLTKCTKRVSEDVLEEKIQIELSKPIKNKSTESHVCALCGTTVKNLKAHLHRHSLERPYKCSMCQKTFTQIGHRNLHVRQVHRVEPSSELQFPPKKKYSCELCTWHSFDSMKVLDDHMQIHISKGRVCEICGKTITPGCITTHLRTHTGSNKYKCTICPMSFPRKDRLEEHLGYHSGEQPFPCFDCDEAFFTSAELKKHTQSQHPRVPSVKLPKPPSCEKSVCDICGKDIILKNMNLHMRTHNGQRPFKCPCCPIAFAQKSNLDTHIVKHSGCKPFHCKPCQKSFHSASALYAHKRNHNIIELIKCELCGRLCTTEKTLLDHCSIEHNIDTTRDNLSISVDSIRIKSSNGSDSLLNGL